MKASWLARRELCRLLRTPISGTRTSAGLVVETESSVDGVTWSSWSTLGAGNQVSSPGGRYLRYRLTLMANASSVAPTLTSIAFNWR